ncbi:MAG TPA: hypothetical protein VHC22_32415 [Pirellulales bacterium]|nr:hypothetical protein [Pirellulales bacterium]
MPSEQDTSRRQIFRQNLHRLAAARRLAFDDLAAALGMRGDHKKWLGRVWENGIDRPDQRTEDNLSKLCEFFQVTQEDLWSQTFQVHYEHILPDKRAWLFWIKKIVENYSLLQQAKLRKANLLRHVVEQYGGSEIEYLADLVADDLGQRPEHIHAPWAYEVLNDLRAERDFHDRAFGKLADFVREHASKHPNWHKFEDELKRELRTQGKDTNSDKDFLRAFDDTVDLLLARMQTPPEICNHFVRTFLEEKPDPVLEARDEDLDWILDELALHPQWSAYLRNNDDAEHEIGENWRATKLKSNSIITREEFVLTVKKMCLDVLIPSDRVEAHQIRGMTKSKRVRSRRRR